MAERAVDLYSAAFVARQRDRLDGDVVSEPGLRGVVRAHEQRTIRLLVLDDRAYNRLAGEIDAGARGVAIVFATAPRCDRLLRDLSGWRSERPTTAMVLRDVGAVPAAALPDGLVLRPVGRLASDAADAVPLEDAVAVAIASDPGISGTADEFASYLRALPSSVRLFAAVDPEGVVRATAGCDVLDGDARVFFVNTEPAWRRRGVGRAMTVEAVRATAASGARRAFLDATVDGASVYLRLGFEVAGRLTRYVRAA